MISTKILVPLAAAILLIPNCGKIMEVKVTVPGSTELVVVLDDSVQTNKNKVGDSFSGHVARSVEVTGKTAIPEGAKVDLVITKLVKSGTLKTQPEIAFTLKEITLQDGKRYPLATSEIYEKGKSHTGRDVEIIGGGAAAGAIIGGLAGKGKGAVVGGVVGAAGGTGVAAATGRQNLVYTPGETVTFTLMQPLTVTVPAEANKRKPE